MTDKELTNILLELAQLSRSIQSSADLHSAMEKYDMMFFGEHFNTIYSLELRHSLLNHFGVDISIKELNNLLPAACISLGMHCEPMVALNDLDNPDPCCYRIVLW